MFNKYKVLRTAEKYVLDRKFAYAVEEYRKLLEQDPEEPSLLNTVGDLLVRQGQTEKALEHYRRVAEIYLQGGFTVKALAMFKKILSVAPDDARVRESVAELYEKQGLLYDAARELKALADHHDAAGRPEQAINVLKKLTSLVPDDPENWVRRARLFARRDNSDTAMSHFAEAIRLHRIRGDFDGGFETALEALSHKSNDHSALQELVEVGDQSGRLGEVREFLEGQLESTGKEYPFQMFLGLVRERMGDPDGAGEIYKSLQAQGFSDPMISQGLVRTGQAVVFDDAPGADVELPSEEPGFFPAEEEESGTDEGFSLVDEEFPPPADELPAQEDDFSIDLADFTSAPKEAFPPPTEEPPFEPEEFSPEPSDDLFAPPQPPLPPEPPDAGQLLEIPLEIEPEEETPVESSGLFSTEAISTEFESFAVEPPLHDDLFEPEEVEFEDFQDESLQVGQPEVASLEEALEEVDFYLKLGFRDDGKQLLEKLLVQFPGDDRVIRRAKKVMPIADLEKLQPQPAKPAAPARADFEDEIEHALGGLFSGADDEEESQEVLRYEVGAPPSKESSSPEVHYNLGLAYKEMGLLDDAIQEFLKADEMLEATPNSPQKILCCSMLANSYLQIGEHGQAANWAREGLEIPDKKDFERKALEYDLAAALEGLGQLGEAMNLYQSILNRDQGYRDVARRADRLRSRAQ